MSPYGTQFFQRYVLEPNHVDIQDKPMSLDQWATLAFSLGIPAAEETRPNPDACKFANKMRRRRAVQKKQMLELLGQLLFAARKDRFNICYKKSTAFQRDAIPDFAVTVSGRPDATRQIPTPLPAMTFGYRTDAFNIWQVDLQNGIIADANEQPCHLGRVSQTLPEVYWPFLVVEIDDESLIAAQHACAATAATCNNALTLLASATYRQQDYTRNRSMAMWDWSKAARSFSLAISNKTACLNFHSSPSVRSHGLIPVRAYQLDNETDVKLLLSRIEGIMIWAEHCRLPAIRELLDSFDRRVNGVAARRLVPRDNDLQSSLVPASTQKHKRKTSGDSTASDIPSLKPKGRLMAIIEGRISPWSKSLVISSTS